MSHFRELNPGPTVYEGLDIASNSPQTSPISPPATSPATTSLRLAADCGVWVASGKPAPHALIARLIVAVLLAPTKPAIRKLAVEAGQHIAADEPVPNAIIGRLTEALLAAETARVTKRPKR